MNEDKMKQAWEAFDKAVSFDEKRAKAEHEGRDQMVSAAARAVERKLDEAVALEAEALAE